MRKIGQIVSLVLIIVSTLTAQELPFSKGVGFGQAFEVSSAQDIHFNYYSKQDFINVKNLGCDVIRLPIFMKNMKDKESGYQFDPLFLFLLDKYVDIAEEVGINLILTNMSEFDYENDPTLRDQLIFIWSNMAKHYKDRSDMIFYEVANEPTNISDEDWNDIQQNIVEVIREVDNRHMIIVTPTGWAAISNLRYMPEYEDDKLIYTFHLYDPMLFTHQGATQVGYGELKGMPFPYDPDRMPPMPSSFVGTWDEHRYNTYSTYGTIERIETLIGWANDFRTERNVPVICDEFGADDKYSAPEDRLRWYETVRTNCEKNGMGWLMHGYTKYWGLFEYGTDKLFDYDLNIPLVETMGLNPQPQSDFVITPDTARFDIYQDYVNRYIDTWISTEEGESHFYCDDPYDGDFCIQIEDFPIWCYFDFRMKPYRDFSYFASNDYVLDFWVKGDKPGKEVQLRFCDTKTSDPGDHPWRMGVNIDETYATWDGKWHNVQIPLSEMIEFGCHDGNWYNPVGEFDWSAISSFQIASEIQSLEGAKFYFDNLRIVKPMKADFTANVTQGTVPLTVQFEDLSVGNINTWNWDFGDGNTSNEQSPAHIYENIGDYTVSLAISGLDGSDNITKTNYISANILKPVVDFTADKTVGMAPLTVQFTNNTSHEVTAWQWNFGDGNTSEEESPSHIYSEGGTFTVSLRATGPGGSDSKVRNNFITVTDQSITCSTPNGGDLFYAGEKTLIRWSKENINSVAIDLSTDNGNNWSNLSPNETVSYYRWTVPEVSSSHCLIKVYSVDDNNIYDISDSTFTILNPTIEIKSPSGGESLNSGKKVQIVWRSIDVDKVNIFYSENNGANWTEIATNINSSDYQYDWSVPDVNSNDCIIKIVNSDYEEYFVESEPFSIINQTSIDNSNITPTEFSLEQNFPNPFNPVTTIKYSIPKTTNVKLMIFSLNGELIETLVDQSQSTGFYQVSWNAKDYPSGIYLYKLLADNFVEERKLILVK